MTCPSQPVVRSPGVKARIVEERKGGRKVGEGRKAGLSRARVNLKFTLVHENTCPLKLLLQSTFVRKEGGKEGALWILLL